jgi:hypothetical protein
MQSIVARLREVTDVDKLGIATLSIVMPRESGASSTPRRMW